MKIRYPVVASQQSKQYQTRDDDEIMKAGSMIQIHDLLPVYKLFIIHIELGRSTKPELSTPSGVNTMARMKDQAKVGKSVPS